MKIERKRLFKYGTILGLFLLLIGGLLLKETISNTRSNLFQEKSKEVAYAPSRGTVILEYLQKEAENQKVFDQLTMDELIAKLDRSLHSTLKGTGKKFATRSLELGLDPYLAVAIVLHETGCKWNCSTLVKKCNNVGGMKGSPGCNGGSYRSFATLDEGIDAYLNNLYNNYVAKGLTTPEQINTKYAASKAWAAKIHYYMDQIKAG